MARRLGSYFFWGTKSPTTSSPTTPDLPSPTSLPDAQHHTTALDATLRRTHRQLATCAHSLDQLQTSSALVRSEFDALEAALAALKERMRLRREMDRIRARVLEVGGAAGRSRSAPPGTVPTLAAVVRGQEVMVRVAGGGVVVGRTEDGEKQDEQQVVVEEEEKGPFGEQRVPVRPTRLLEIMAVKEEGLDGRAGLSRQRPTLAVPQQKGRRPGLEERAVTAELAVPMGDGPAVQSTKEETIVNGGMQAATPKLPVEVEGVALREERAAIGACPTLAGEEEQETAPAVEGNRNWTEKKHETVQDIFEVCDIPVVQQRRPAAAPQCGKAAPAINLAMPEPSPERVAKPQSTPAVLPTATPRGRDTTTARAGPANDAGTQTCATPPTAAARETSEQSTPTTTTNGIPLHKAEEPQGEPSKRGFPPQPAYARAQTRMERPAKANRDSLAKLNLHTTRERLQLWKKMEAECGGVDDYQSWKSRKEAVV